METTIVYGAMIEAAVHEFSRQREEVWNVGASLDLLLKTDSFEF